jgi:hypothetical protein
VASRTAVRSGDRRRGGGRASAMIDPPTAFGHTTVGGTVSPDRFTDSQLD